MSVIQNNAPFSLTGWQRVARRLVTNQPTGAQWEYVYEGTKANLLPLAENLDAKGARITLELRPGKSTLTALWGFDPGSSPETGDPSTGETPAQNWEINAEPVQYSVFNLPSVAKEAEKYVTVAQYKADLENAVKNGEAFPFSQTEYPKAYTLFTCYLSRGIEYWEGYRPVIRRNLSYSSTYNNRTTPERVSPTTKVYTRDALIRIFSVPATFQPRIPLEPDPAVMPLPRLSAWGWRQRTSTAGYSQMQRKWEEVSEWDFAAWPTDLYEVVT